MYPAPRILTAGEGAFVVEFADTVSERANEFVRLLDVRVRRAAAASVGVARPWLVGTVPTYRSLLVIFDPLRVSREQVCDLLASSAAEMVQIGPGQSGGPAIAQAGLEGATAEQRRVTIPVCYEGDLAPDLAGVAGLTGLSTESVVSLHTGAEYLVHMIGFLIGYPYMASLPAEMRVPRLARPRLKTPRGSVAIAGELTGIYPLPSPGGWHVLGTTPWPMYDLSWDPPALLRPGDRVGFRRVSHAEYDRLLLDPGIPPALYHSAGMDGYAGVPGQPAPEAGPLLRIIRPGLLTTVQDLGRPGYHRYGVGPGGAMDKFALRAANRLLGNDDGAAALELTGPGAVVEFTRPCRFVWAVPAGEAALDTRTVAPWTVIDARAGQRLSITSLRLGLRSYLALAGGIAAPLVLGSRSTSLAVGFGGPFGRACRAGDELEQAAAAGEAGRLAASGDVIDAVYGRLRQPVRCLHVLPGLQADMIGGPGLSVLYGSTYRISPDSNRMGYRLEGPPVRSDGGHDIVSDGLIEGAIQVPGNGQPVLLTSEHQTTGGYPKPGVVTSADLPLVAQLSPGSEVRFQPVDAAAAQAELLALEHRVAEAAGQMVDITMQVNGRQWRARIDVMR